MDDDAEVSRARFRRTFLVILALAITLLFLWMIWDFLLALLLAALAAAMSYRPYKRLLARLGGRKNWAAGVTLALLLLLVIAPLAAFVSIVLSQAVEVSRAVTPWVREHMNQATELDRLLSRYPRLAPLAPYRDQIVVKLGELGGALGSYALGFMTAAARELARFFLLAFVMLYSTFFFLTHGTATLSKMLYYFPLPAEDETRMVDRFLSVARATLKGTFVVGFVQGSLGGLAFWVAGISGPAVWAAFMMVLSVVPGVGAAIVWVPTAVYLLLTGHTTVAVVLALWFSLVVGSVDNFLRPWLVGKDTRMPDLLILLSTLGGILLVGAAGFVIGPIVAALFVTIWELYGDAFRGVLPEPPPLSIPSPPPRTDSAAPKDEPPPQ
jgi:predicted PurR-regulated permease PerM